MAPQSTAPAALSEDSGSIPSTRFVAHNHCNSSSTGSNALSWHQACMGYTDIHTGKAPYIKNKIK